MLGACLRSSLSSPSARSPREVQQDEWCLEVLQHPQGEQASGLRSVQPVPNATLPCRTQLALDAGGR